MSELVGEFLCEWDKNKVTYIQIKVTVCPGSSDPPEKMFVSENEVYTIY